MPTTVEHFTSPSPTIPQRVYLDTSFVLRCYFSRHTPKGIPPGEIAKNSKCNQYLIKLSGSSIHTSLFMAEESFHKLYFTTHIRRAAKPYGLENKWKDFRKNHPSEFAVARNLGIQELQRFVKFIDSLPIIYVDGSSFFKKQKYLALVKRYAQLLMQKYDTIEAMDTFHLAVMRANRIDWFVTAEEKLGSGFDECSILTL